MPQQLFITGTDTEVGKTYVSVGILKAFNKVGLSTLGIKPVASDSKLIGDNLYNDDALALQAASSIKLEYKKINPFVFKPPIAPHIAAQQINCALNLQTLNKNCEYALNYPADIRLIEGAGGWYTPLNNKESIADFVLYHQLKVILVVGIRLGCINHAILTLKAIQQSGVHVLGWIANCLQPNMLACEENIDTLRAWLNVPCLGVVNYGDEVEEIIDAETIHSCLLRRECSSNCVSIKLSQPQI